MAGEFNSLFAYAGDPISNGFYTLISPCKNSMECHKTILELFMNALKLSSMRYRTGAFPTSPVIPSIPTSAVLDSLLKTIPEELQNPWSQVLFEQYSLVADTTTKPIGDNAWYIKTYSGSTVPTTLQNAVDQVRSFIYAEEFNKVQYEYSQKPWASGKNITPPIALTTPNAAPQKATVLSSLQNLSAWISANDPELFALTTLKSRTITEILADVFGTAPVANISAKDFCAGLIKQIQIAGSIIVDGQKQAKTVFFTDIQTMLKVGGSIWQTTASLKVLSDQINSKTPTDINKNSATVSITFSRIIELFDTALSDLTAVTATKAQLKTVFETYNTHTPSATTYLLDRLKATCDSLTTTTNPDPQILLDWRNEINEVVPTTVYHSDISALMDLVIDQISTMLLNTSSTPTPVRLFGFSNYNDISANSKVVMFPLGKSSYDTNTVRVLADEAENNTDYFRPVYGVFTKNNAGVYETFYKFFNVVLADGTYYFTDPNNPQVVKQDYFPGPLPTGITFDFDKVSINDSEVVPASGCAGFPANQPYKTVTGSSVSKSVFYTCVRQVSKWKSLSGQRRFDVVYQTVLGTPVTIITHLIWYMSSGDLNRTDHINDELYVWEWMANETIQSQYPQIPELLGLSLDRRVSEDAENKPAFTKHASGATSMDLLCFKPVASTCEVYVLTNTPNPSIPTSIDEALGRSTAKSDALSEQAKTILEIFNFQYYRRLDLVTEKIIKWIPASNRPNSTSDGDTIDVPNPPLPNGYAEAIGINTPISFQPLQNLIFFKACTAQNGPTGASLKNKGNILFRPKGDRAAAGNVMAKLRDNITVSPKPGTANSLSASQLSAFELSKSADILELWQDLKATNRSTLPTDQEWCHLLGHGDGGDERLGNFASGSFHCNTEQLAMESKGRRNVTKAAPKGTYTLRSTAYMFNAGEDLLNGNYLTNDAAYNKMKKVYATLKKPSTQPVPVDKSGNVLPFAAFMRYKIYNQDPTSDPTTRASYQKLFDHIFEGQSEFLDEHQFNILKYTTWFCVAGVNAYKEWYKEQTKASADGAMEM